MGCGCIPPVQLGAVAVELYGHIALPKARHKPCNATPEYLVFCCLLLAFPLGMQLPGSSPRVCSKSKAHCLCEICPTPPPLGQAQVPGAHGHGAVAWLVIG